MDNEIVRISTQSDSQILSKLEDIIVTKWEAKIVKKESNKYGAYIDFSFDKIILTLSTEKKEGTHIFPKQIEEKASQANTLAKLVGEDLKRILKGNRSIVAPNKNNVLKEIELSTLYNKISNYRHLALENIKPGTQDTNAQKKSCHICNVNLNNNTQDVYTYKDDIYICKNCYDTYIDNEQYLEEIAKSNIETQSSSKKRAWNKLVLFLLILVLTLFSIGIYYQYINRNLIYQRFMGFGVLILVFVLFPVFIFHRYRYKQLSDYKFKGFK